MELVPLGEALAMLPPARSSVHLELPDDLSYEDWARLGPPLSLIAASAMWWWGDWCRFGRRFGEDRFLQAAESSGYAVQTLRNAASVAEAFSDVSRRREALHWGHHEAVAALAPEQQDDWLDRAESNGWTVHETRRRRSEWERSVKVGEAPAPRPDMSPRAKVWVTIEADGEHFDMLTTAARKAVDGLRQWFETVGVAAKLGVEVVDDGSPVKAA
jgi:hypothetical protein